MPQPRVGERLSAADASNIVIDARDQVNAFLLAGILGVGGFVSVDGSLDMEKLRATIDARLCDPAFKDLVRFSQRVHHDGSLRWEDCKPNLDWHIRLSAPVSSRQGLADLCATLMSEPLPLDRPMWELLIVQGTSPEGPGVVLRMHHAVADGVSAVRLVQRLFDGSTPAAAPSSTPPATGPSPRRDRGRWRAFATSVSRVLAMFRTTVPRTVLLGPISAKRGVAFADVPLETLTRAAKAAGATVNDALLAAAMTAVEATLLADGHPVPSVLPASVPVALPDRGSSGNAVGVMVVQLPAGEPDTRVRLTRIAAATRLAKPAARSQGTFELTRTLWGSRLFSWLARRQRFVALFVTNVRGPDVTMRVGGAPLVQAWAVAPIQGNVRFGIAAMSYAGRLGVTVHVDAGVLQEGVAGRALGEELARIARI